MQSPHGGSRRQVRIIAVLQSMLGVVGLWLAVVVCGGGLLGGSLLVLLPTLAYAAAHTAGEPAAPTAEEPANQAELAYAKGIVEYGKGNYLDALEHFRTVVELTPEDANGQFYLGLTQSRLGEFTEAIRHFAKALQLDPTLQPVHYNLGFAYFQEERYSEALEQFQRAEQFDPQNAAVYFYQGYILHQLKRYQEALPPLEHALQLDPSIALSAQYYRGLALFGLDRDTPAREAFEAARAVDPQSTIAQNAQHYLAAIKIRERERRLWQVEGNASLQYDDNVTVGNDIVISRQSDGSTVYGVAARGFAVRTPRWHVGAEYNFFQSLHFTLHEFDIRSHTFGLLGRLQLEPLTLRLGANYNIIDLNNARLSEAFTVTPSVTIQQAETLFALVAVQYRTENFFHDVLPEQMASVRSRDGWNVRTGFDQFWLFNKQRAFVRAGYHYEVQRSVGSDWDHNGHEVSLGVQTPLWLGLMLDVNGTYNRSNYQHINSFSCCIDDRGGLGVLDANDTQKRTDRRFTARVTLWRDVGPYLTVSASFMHVSNPSHVDFFDYRRNVATLVVSGRY